MPATCINPARPVFAFEMPARRKRTYDCTPTDVYMLKTCQGDTSRTFAGERERERAERERAEREREERGERREERG